VYLINSLNLSQLQGFGVGHIDHPGTTVQIIGAIVIMFSSVSNIEIVSEIFNNSELYLSKINLVIYFLNSFALFIFGIIAFKKFKDLKSAVILQLTPFFSTILFFRIPKLAPETVIIFTILILLSIIIFFTTKEDKNSTVNYVIGFGLICGFALATKISLFPLLIIPFILLRKFSVKISFCLVTIIAFFIFIFPAISSEHSYKFLNWIRKLIMFSGKYGGGEKNYVNVSNFFVNLKTIIIKEPVFSLSYLIILLSFFAFLIPENFKKFKPNQTKPNQTKPNQTKPNHQSRYFKLLFAFLTAITIQIIIVCKHFELHYLIPAQLLIIPCLFVINELASELLPNFFRRKKFLIFSIVLTVFTLIQIKSIYELFEYKSQTNESARNFIGYLENNCKECLIVNTYGVSSKEEALFIGASYGGSRRNYYFSILNNKFPNSIFYDKWSKEIVNVDSLDVEKVKIRNSKKFLFLCNDENSLNDFLNTIKELTTDKNLTVNKVYSNFYGESIYEIKLN